jgi:hypothetical protein
MNAGMADLILNFVCSAKKVKTRRCAVAAAHMFMCASECVWCCSSLVWNSCAVVRPRPLLFVRVLKWRHCVSGGHADRPAGVVPHRRRRGGGGQGLGSRALPARVLRAVPPGRSRQLRRQHLRGHDVDQSALRLPARQLGLLGAVPGRRRGLAQRSVERVLQRAQARGKLLETTTTTSKRAHALPFLSWLDSFLALSFLLRSLPRALLSGLRMCKSR